MRALQQLNLGTSRVVSGVDSFRQAQPGDVCKDYNAAKAKFATLSATYLEAKTKENVLKVIHSAAQGAVVECGKNRATLVEKAELAVEAMRADATRLDAEKAARVAARAALVAEAAAVGERRDALVAAHAATPTEESSSSSSSSSELTSSATCEAALGMQAARVQALNARKVELEDRVEEQRWEMSQLEARAQALRAQLDAATPTPIGAPAAPVAAAATPKLALADMRAHVATIAQHGGVTVATDAESTLLLQGYRLTLAFADDGSSALRGAALSPSDVVIDDVVAAAVAPGLHGGASKGAAWLVREVRARLCERERA